MFVGIGEVKKRVCVCFLAAVWLPKLKKGKKTLATSEVSKGLKKKKEISALSPSSSSHYITNTKH